MKDRTNKGLALKLKFVIMILLIANGLLSLIIEFGWWKVGVRTMDTTFWLKIAAYCLVVVGGIIIYMMKKHDTKIIIGATGIVIGLADLIASSMIIYNSLKIVAAEDIVFLAIYALVPLVDIALIIFSIRYMQGHRRNAMRMSVCVFVPLFIYTLNFIMAISLMRNDAQTFWLNVTTSLPAAILYGVFFWFLLIPGIREDLSGWKLYKLNRDLYKSSVADPKSSIYRADLIVLMEKMKKPETWDESALVPDSKECSIRFGKDMNLRRMTFRKMADSDNIRVSIIPENTKECIQATRFDLNEIVPVDGYFSTCKSVRFYGHDGFFIDLDVRDDEPKPRKTYAIDRFIDRLKFSRVNKRKD